MGTAASATGYQRKVMGMAASATGCQRKEMGMAAKVLGMTANCPALYWEVWKTCFSPASIIANEMVKFFPTL